MCVNNDESRTPMNDTLPDTAAASPVVRESGTVRWFNQAKRTGVIMRPDSTTIFIPPYGFAREGENLLAGQAVTFVEKTNAIGPYAADVDPVSPASDTLESIVPSIAKALQEKTRQAYPQILRIIREIGVEQTQTYIAEALQVEEAGGMLLADGSRRRTLGGVFFAIVRQRLTPDQRAIVFPPIYAKHKKKAQQKTTQEPAPLRELPALLTWADRLDPIVALQTQSGKVDSVKVTLIGRPSKVTEYAQCVLLALTYTGPLPALPKGIPVPNPLPATNYSVYIGKKQWRTVVEALKNTDDILIIEGVQVLDATTNTIAVFATKTTTKLLQQASRQQKLQSPADPQRATASQESFSNPT
jgi:cold shock CspA family protein